MEWKYAITPSIKSKVSLLSQKVSVALCILELVTLVKNNMLGKLPGGYKHTSMTIFTPRVPQQKCKIIYQLINIK